MKYEKNIVLSFLIVSYLIGQGITDFISIKWNKESRCFSIEQGTPGIYSIIQGNGRDKKDILALSDTIFKPDNKQKETVFFLE